MKKQEVIIHGNFMDVYNYNAMIKNQSESGETRVHPIQKVSKGKTLKKVLKNSNYKRR